ncbi:MAG: hypothetical protein ABJA50_04050 [Chloroflexota bacterium]
MVYIGEQTNMAASVTQHQPRRLSLSTHLLALGGYTALTLILTYPVALRLSSEVPGGGDAWANIWNLWWVKQALLDRHINPYHTDMLYYPGGVNLYLHTLTLTAGLISIPLQLLGFNLLATYNLVLLLSFVLAGYGAFLLCHYLSANRWASFVGGAIFTFAPYHFAHLLGHMNLVSLQWIPLYVLVLLKALDARGAGTTKSEGQYELTTGPPAATPAAPDVHPETADAHGHGGSEKPQPELSALPRFSSWPQFGHSGLKYAAAAGALLALNAYTDWLYAIFLVLFTALLLGWRLLMPSERRLFREVGTGWAEGSVRLLVGALVFLLLIAPILFPTLAEAQQGYAQESQNETLIYSSDVMLAFTPSELHPIWGKSVTESIAGIGPYMPQKGPSERDVFLGYTVIGLALYAWWRLRANRQVRFWLFAALATWVLSLGPELQLFGKSKIPLLGATIPLPYALLDKLPLLSIARTPSRLTVLTMLAMSVLASLALTALLSRAGKTGRSGLPEASHKFTRGHIAVALGLPLLILFEFLAIPFPTVPPGWDVGIYQKIAAEPGRFALLELPLRPLGDYMAYQTIHGKPIIGGFLARQPPYPLVEQTPVLTYLLDTTGPSDPLEGRIANGKGVQSLRDLGVKYVIIHWWLLTPDQKKEMEAKLTAVLGRSADFEYPANQVAAWQIGGH